MRPIQRVAAFHDLSGFGRCALTVVLPILSAMGFQACPVPTAVLSTHTGIPGFVVRDMSDIIQPWLRHWDDLGIGFDGLYSGYLGSPRQVDMLIPYFEAHQEARKLIDPVMGDDGALYPNFDTTMVEAMRRLLRYADIITPNLTEACLLTGIPYHDRDWKSADIEALSRALAALGAKQGAITSIPLEDGSQCNASYDEDLHIHLFPYARIDAQFPGTGDAFASVLIGNMLRGLPIKTALDTSTNYASMLARESAKTGAPPSEGICLEAHLYALMPQEYHDPALE